jgi:hypothetical protein
MNWIFGFIIIYGATIAGMCWASANKAKKPTDKKIRDFIEKNIKRYK